jgi:hypothetical protein
LRAARAWLELVTSSLKGNRGRLIADPGR